MVRIPKIGVERGAAGELRIQPGDRFTGDAALMSHVPGATDKKSYS
jgi:hypothetical protein